MEGTLRKKSARALRKWADLIDPRVKPTADGTGIVVNVSCIGAEDVEATIARLAEKMKELVEIGDHLKELV